MTKVLNIIALCVIVSGFFLYGLYFNAVVLDKAHRVQIKKNGKLLVEGDVVKFHVGESVTVHGYEVLITEK